MRKSLLNYRSEQGTADWWDSLSEEEKAEIELGVNQADNGNLISHEEILKKYSKWL